MELQRLFDLADREIKLGHCDETLMEKATSESKGVTAFAHQQYWQLRAVQLQEDIRSNGENTVLAIEADLLRMETSNVRNANLSACGWAIVGTTGATACFILGVAGRAAYAKHSPNAGTYMALALLCFCLALTGPVLSRIAQRKIPSASK